MDAIEHAPASASLADRFGIVTAIWTVAAMTALSGVIVGLRMYETHQPGRT